MRTVTTAGPAVRRSPWPVRAFAVDDTSAQLTWRASPAEGLRLEIGDVVAHPEATAQAELALSVIFSLSPPHRAGLRAPAERGPSSLAGQWRRRTLDPAWPAGPGSVVVDGLTPGTTYDVVARAEGVPSFLAGRLRTLRPPGGRLLCRFATVSDVHIGERHFGILGRIHDGAAGETYPHRALQAAMAEAVDWGAELMVVKGDLTRFTAAAEVRDAGRLIAACRVPVETMLGNHDNQHGVDGRAILESQGVDVSWQPRARDLPGLRLVLLNTTHGVPHHHGGQVPADVSRRAAALAAEAGTPAWVGLHHPPETHRLPTVYPPGIPWDESRVLLSGLAAAQPATFVTCGHRHRNRRYRYGPLVISEVGSTKDYPGVWAGYRVFEGGLIQTVRRISRPDVMAWTESTRRAMNGQWHRWAPGRLEDRCFTVRWAAPPASG